MAEIDYGPIWSTIGVLTFTWLGKESDILFTVKELQFTSHNLAAHGDLSLIVLVLPRGVAIKRWCDQDALQGCNVQMVELSFSKKETHVD